jgi:hypothetical protein
LRSRSVWESNGTLDIRCQVPSRHHVHLRVIDVRCGGRWRSMDAASRRGDRTYRSFICIERDSGGFGFLGRAVYPYDQTHPRDPVRNDYPPAMRRSIEFVLIGPVLRSRVIRRLSQDRGQHLRKLRIHQMVAPNEDQPHHSSSGYPTIRRSEASDTRTPST